MVPKQNCFHVPALPATRGTMQGKLVSPTLFNVVVDNVIKTWLDMTVEDQRVAQDGLGETVRRCLGILYADYGMVVSRDSDWLQHTLNVLLGFFRRYGLASNIAKSCTMNYQTRALRAGMSEEAMALRCTGVGDSYQVRLQRRIPFPECVLELTVGSMKAHRRRMHRTEPAIDLSRMLVIQTVHQPHVYDARFLRIMKQCPCPLPGFPGPPCTWNGLRSHFNRNRWGDRIRILEEDPNPFPMCERCGSQVPMGRLSNCHYMSEKFSRERKGASGAISYNDALRQVGSCYRSNPISYHRRRHYHTWGG